MMQFSFVNFAVFNVADCFVTFGAVMLGVWVLWFWDKHKKTEKKMTILRNKVKFSKISGWTRILRKNIRNFRVLFKELDRAGTHYAQRREDKSRHQGKKEGDEIVLRLPEVEGTSVAPQDIPLEIVYQDSDIAVINKPQGMVTHPAPGNYDGTLVNAILYHIGDLSGINGELRPGIVHRLDKDTSGLLVIAKNDAAHKALSEQIADKKARRIYWALVYGNIKANDGVVDTLIGRDPRDRKKMAVLKAGGREAVTRYRILERYGGIYPCGMRTGNGADSPDSRSYEAYRASGGGDPVYSRQKDRFGLSGQLLHARKLELTHPRTGERMIFEAPLPEYFTAVLAKLKKNVKTD